MKRSEWIANKHKTLRKVADEAEANFLKAEDVLTALEDREARRASRTKSAEGVPPALAAMQEGRL